MKKKNFNREPYLPEFLNSLRQDVIDKFLENTHSKGVRMLVFSTNKHKQIYSDLNEDFKRCIKETFDGETLVRFFYRKIDDNKNEIPLSENQVFFVTTIKSLRKYTEIAASDTKDDYVQLHNNFNGALVINNSFEKQITKNTSSYLEEDFYLSKQEGGCQWYGIISELDYRRPVHWTLKKEIVLCFKRKSKVVAVLHGIGGCGKSTSLRRLAMDCINLDYIILWLTDPLTFLLNDTKIIKSTPKRKYVLFIDDWNIVERSAFHGDFLNILMSIDNIRLIIGDRDIINKEYMDYLFGDNRFELTSNENQIIINHIFSNSSYLKTVDTELLLTTEFYESPLFVILFVLTSVNSDEPNKVNLKTSDAFSQFKNVIQYDLKTIYNNYHGLGIALNYWANVYSQYKILITWDAFLNLCNHFGNKKISNKISNLDSKDPTKKILKRYINLEQVVVEPHTDQYVFNFHHDIIAEALKYPIYKKHIFNNQVKIDMISCFFKTAQVDALFSLYESIANEELITGGFKKLFDTFLAFNIRSTLLLHQNHIVKYAYYNAENYNPNSDWVMMGINIAWVFRNNPSLCNIIFENLIKKGCENSFIKASFEMTKTKAHQDIFFKEVKSTVEQMASIDNEGKS